MEATATNLVLYRDTLEDDATPHFGIRFDNDWILCLCCGGWVEPEDYEIIKEYNGFDYVDDTFKANYLTDDEYAEFFDSEEE